jgi:hypothetical protein
METGQGPADAGLFPKGERLRRAVRWLGIRLTEGHPASLKLVEEAAFRFDLSPREEEFLLKEWLEGGARPSQQEGE